METAATDDVITFENWRVVEITPSGDIVTEVPDTADVMARLAAFARHSAWTVLALDDGRRRFIVPDENRLAEVYREEELILVPEPEANRIRIVARSREGAKHPSDGNAARRFGIGPKERPSIVAAENGALGSNSVV